MAHFSNDQNKGHFFPSAMDIKQSIQSARVSPTNSKLFIPPQDIQSNRHTHMNMFGSQTPRVVSQVNFLANKRHSENLSTSQTLLHGNSREWKTIHDRNERSGSRIKTHGMQRAHEKFTLSHPQSKQSKAEADDKNENENMTTKSKNDISSVRNRIHNLKVENAQLSQLFAQRRSQHSTLVINIQNKQKLSKQVHKLLQPDQVKANQNNCFKKQYEVDQKYKRDPAKIYEATNLQQKTNVFYTQRCKSAANLNHTQRDEPIFSQYFMNVLNGSDNLKQQGKLHQRRKSGDDFKSPAMMEIHQNNLNNTLQESSFSFFKGIGQNHKKDFQSNFNKKNAINFDVQLPEVIVPKASKEPEPEDFVDQEIKVPTKMTNQQFSKSDIFYPSPYDFKPKRVSQADQTIEFVTVELENLPSDANAASIKKLYFKDAHVVKTDQKIDHVTGKSQRTALVKVRCQNESISNQFLQTLNNNGANFKVKKIEKATDRSNQLDNNRFTETQDIVNHKRNQWLNKNIISDQDKQYQKFVIEKQSQFYVRSTDTAATNITKAQSAVSVYNYANPQFYKTQKQDIEWKMDKDSTTNGTSTKSSSGRVSSQISKVHTRTGSITQKMIDQPVLGKQRPQSDMLQNQIVNINYKKLLNERLEDQTFVYQRPSIENMAQQSHPKPQNNNHISQYMNNPAHTSNRAKNLNENNISQSQLRGLCEMIPARNSQLIELNPRSFVTQRTSQTPNIQEMAKNIQIDSINTQRFEKQALKDNLRNLREHIQNTSNGRNVLSDGLSRGLFSENSAIQNISKQIFNANVKCIKTLPLSHQNVGRNNNLKDKRQISSKENTVSTQFNSQKSQVQIQPIRAVRQVKQISSQSRLMAQTKSCRSKLLYA